MIKDLKAPSDI